MKTELWISIMSAIGAFASAVFAYRSNIIASKALEISKQDQEKHNANIIPYLIEGIRRKQGEQEILAFAVSYTNRSDLPNSLLKIELEINYSAAGGVRNHLLFPIADNPSSISELSDLPSLRVPINLAPRSTASGWLLFIIPTVAIKGSVDKYRVIGLTATGDRITMESFLIKSIFNADEKNTS